MMVMSPLDDPVGPTALARLRPLAAGRVLVWLAAGDRYPLAPCLALTLQHRGSIVLRRETGGVLRRDDVLGRRGRSDAQWVGHWLIRLDALAGSVGRTRAILCEVPWRPDLFLPVEILRTRGACVRFIQCSSHEGGVA